MYKGVCHLPTLHAIDGDDKREAQLTVAARNDRTEAEPPAASSIGARLRQFLMWHNLSIRAFSDRSGVPYRTLQDYLTNKRKPGAEHLASMGRGGVDLNWLLVDEDAYEDHFSSARRMLGFRTDVLKSNQALCRAMVAKCDMFVDDANADFAALHGRPMTRLHINHLWNLTFKHVVAAADAMEHIVNDLIARGVPNETIADIVFRTLRKRALPDQSAPPT
jgi:hypothetical protein